MKYIIRVILLVPFILCAMLAFSLSFIFGDHAPVDRLIDLVEWILDMCEISFREIDFE